MSTEEPILELYHELGPSKVVHLYDPPRRWRGVVVVDNTACGPAIGGVRIAADIRGDPGRTFREQNEIWVAGG